MAKTAPEPDTVTEPSEAEVAAQFPSADDGRPRISVDEVLHNMQHLFPQQYQTAVLVTERDALARANEALAAALAAATGSASDT